LQPDGCPETPLRGGKRGSDERTRCLTEWCLRRPPAKNSPQQRDFCHNYVLSWLLFGQRQTQCRVGQPCRRHCIYMYVVMLHMYSTPIKTVRTKKKKKALRLVRLQTATPRQGSSEQLSIAYTGVAWRESYCCGLSASRPCGGSPYQLRSVAFSPPVSRSRRSLLLRTFSPEEHPSTPPPSLPSSSRPTALTGCWPGTMQ